MNSTRKLTIHEQIYSFPELEENRRTFYVGMTRARDRLVFTRCVTRNGKLTGGTRFLDELGLTPVAAP